MSPELSRKLGAIVEGRKLGIQDVTDLFEQAAAQGVSKDDLPAFFSKGLK